MFSSYKVVIDVLVNELSLQRVSYTECRYINNAATDR